MSPQQLLEFLLQNILEDSTQVTVNSREENEVSTLEITAPDDIKGRIIGKAGRIIKAIRTIVSISFPKQRIIVKVTD